MQAAIPVGAGIFFTNLFYSNAQLSAIPEDYHPKVLTVQEPVSFHKFWNTDPRAIYRKWFHDSDADLAALKAGRASHSHTEL